MKSSALIPGSHRDRRLHAYRGGVTTYPALARRPSDDDVPELTSARMLADACNDLLIELYDHRLNVAQRLRALQHPEQTAWPF
jgi:hypothetical protein